MTFASIVIDNDSATPRVTFGTTGGGAWPAWDRFLLIDGKQAYLIGNVCGTCSFFFEKREHANRTFSAEVSADEIADRLNNSREVLEATFLRKLGSILELGSYRVHSRLITPSLVMPGDARDYFARECIDLFGIDGYFGVPHSPKTPYYRCSDITLEPARLFDLVIPLHQPGTLSADRITHYESFLEAGNVPTALAISVLDIKAPADPGDATPSEHWCLANYLLDGHHKLRAAAITGRPLCLLSFVSVAASIARSEDLVRLESVFAKNDA